MDSNVEGGKKGGSAKLVGGPRRASRTLLFQTISRVSSETSVIILAAQSRATIWLFRNRVAAELQASLRPRSEGSTAAIERTGEAT